MEDEKNDSSEKDNFLVNLDDYQAVRNFSNGCVNRELMQGDLNGLMNKLQLIILT